MAPSTRPPHNPDLGDACECFGCHVRGVQIGLPSDFRSRSTYLKVAPKTPDNSYGKAVPVSRRPDGSAMPYLRADGDPMHQREFDQKRHRIDDNRARLEASASQTA